MARRDLIFISTAIICYLCGFIDGKAQNLLYYAKSAEGEMDYVLFPNEGGKVCIHDTIVCEHTLDDIKDAVDSYMVYLGSQEGVKIKSKGNARRFQAYDATMEFGSSLISLPGFVYDRDASRLHFTITLAESDSLCIVNLSNFETNRTTLRGEAKNDGDPNVIHWQRVNALARECEIQAANCRSDRERRSVKYDYDRQIAFEHYLYANEANGLKCLLDGLRQSLASEEFGVPAFKRQAVPAVYSPIQEKKRIAIFDKSDFHGNLLAPHNNVYIESAQTSHECSGAAELRKQIELDDLWTVTTDKNKAHFVIIYAVNTEGRDKAYITITDSDGGKLVDRFYKNKISSSESDDDNRESARALYSKALKPLYENIKKGNLPKEFSQYIIP